MAMDAVKKLKKSKKKLDERPVPAGATGGAMGNSDPDKVSGTIRNMRDAVPTGQRNA